MVEVFEISEDDREYWDLEIARFPSAHPLNAFGWGKVRSIDGWRPYYLLAKKAARVTGGITILVKKIPCTGLSIMYAPRGPVWDPSDQETLEGLLHRARRIARKHHAIFLRIDPNIQERDFKDRDPLKNTGFRHLEDRWTFWNTPRDVLRIDLGKSNDEEALFMTFQPDARRCIRKARKEGVTVRPAENLDELKEFFNVFTEFSVEKGFMSRGFIYQKALWDQYIMRDQGVLFIALKEGHIIGGSICLAYTGKCLGMHMGSISKFYKSKVNDLLEWESIKWAKERSYRWFSFRGTGPTPSLDKFKRKFGPELVSLVGYYDLPFYRPLYWLAGIGEFKLLPRCWRVLVKIRQMVYNLQKR
jgi:lipid II:glycine glycyltransferase (peptidoglycan interpeptide bridge formation enzyme)